MGKPFSTTLPKTWTPTSPQVTLLFRITCCYSSLMKNGLANFISLYCPAQAQVARCAHRFQFGLPHRQNCTKRDNLILKTSRRKTQHSTKCCFYTSVYVRFPQRRRLSRSTLKRNQDIFFLSNCLSSLGWPKIHVMPLSTWSLWDRRQKVTKSIYIEQRVYFYTFQIQFNYHWT